MTLYFGDLLPYIPLLLNSLWVSLYVTLIAVFVGSSLGVLLYLGKTSRVPFVRLFSNAYIEVFRNTPLLVQLYLIYFGSSQFSINLNPISAGIIALTLNNAAYTAEIYRAGFESVPKGLIEAGRALGMGPVSVFRNVMLMPATRNVFPALTNQFILVFLASSIASIIGLPELMTTILDLNNKTSLAIETLAVGGAIYYIATAVIAAGSRYTEKRLFGWAVKAHV